MLIIHLVPLRLGRDQCNSVEQQNYKFCRSHFLRFNRFLNTILCLGAVFPLSAEIDLKRRKASTASPPYLAWKTKKLVSAKSELAQERNKKQRRRRLEVHVVDEEWAGIFADRNKRFKRTKIWTNLKVLDKIVKIKKTVYRWYQSFGFAENKIIILCIKATLIRNIF